MIPYNYTYPPHHTKLRAQAPTKCGAALAEKLFLVQANRSSLGDLRSKKNNFGGQAIILSSLLRHFLAMKKWQKKQGLAVAVANLFEINCIVR
jgi:hypothetical protein